MAGDPTKVAPHAYKTVFENDRVRILNSTMGPGETTDMHGHPDHIGVAITACKFKFTMGNGEAIEGDLAPGEAGFFDATEHSTENTGREQMQVIIIELK